MADHMEVLRGLQSVVKIPVLCQMGEVNVKATSTTVHFRDRSGTSLFTPMSVF